MTTLTVSPSQFEQGQSTTLSWTGSNGGSLRITLPSGNRSTYQTSSGSGSRVYRPAAAGGYRAELLNARPPRKSLVWVTFSVTATPPVPEPSDTTLFGTLITDVNHAQEAWSVGLRSAMVENFGWIGGAAWTASQARTLKGLGFHVTLEPGFHNATPPLPRYTDNFGNFVGRANLTWSALARGEAERMVEALRVAFGGSFASLDALRVGAGGNVELLYASGGTLAAYDPVAQARCPLPGLRPGQAGDWATWYGWYLDELVAEARWRDSLFRVRGFAGTTHVLLPGLGATPSAVRAAYAANMTSGMSVVGRGAAWDLVIPKFRGTGFVIHCSSVAESRGQTDITQPSDALVTPPPDGWSAMRRTAALATANGLRSSGENPGFGDSAGYGPAMRDAAIAQSRAAHYVTFGWAHHKNLRDGTAGFSLSDFGAAIR